jgi:hypothetical protein
VPAAVLVGRDQCVVGVNSGVVIRPNWDMIRATAHRIPNPGAGSSALRFMAVQQRASVGNGSRNYNQGLHWQETAISFAPIPPWVSVHGRRGPLRGPSLFWGPKNLTTAEGMTHLADRRLH